MLFIMYCVDKPEHEQVRAANRGQHLEYLKKFESQIIIAGPTLAENAQRMTGSVLFVEFPDRAAVEEFSRNDPYTKAGLFESVIIRPWRKTTGKGFAE